MKRNVTVWLILSAIIMPLLPWLAVTFIKAHGGMAACLALLFGINPIYSVVVGVFAGKNSNQLWHLPIISALLFLLGTWLFLQPSPWPANSQPSKVVSMGQAGFGGRF